jgi:hypothetical protein
MTVVDWVAMMEFWRVVQLVDQMDLKMVVLMADLLVIPTVVLKEIKTVEKKVNLMC